MWRLFYFADVVGTLNAALSWIVVITAIVFVITFIFRLIFRFSGDYDIDNEKDSGGDINEEKVQYSSLCKLNRWTLALLIISLVGQIATPSKNTIYLMAGGKLVDMTIENNPQIKEVPGKTIDLLNAWLEKETGEIKGQENNQQEEVGK